MKTQLPITTWKNEPAFALTPKIGFESGLQRFSAACLDKLHNLKERITGELAARFRTLRPELVRLAVNEAAALAASTAFPAFILPALAEEKVQLVSRWQTKQRLIQEQSWLRAA